MPKEPHEYAKNPLGYSGKWKKAHGNYLAYWVSMPDSDRVWLMTVRWVNPSK